MTALDKLQNAKQLYHHLRNESNDAWREFTGWHKDGEKYPREGIIDAGDHELIAMARERCEELSRKVARAYQDLQMAHIEFDNEAA